MDKKLKEKETLDQLCIGTIRTLSMDAVQKANSGHPGTPMALAPVAFVLWDKFMRHNPRNPDWPNRDRFVLSVGHASMLLYSTLHILGYDISLDDIKRFRQLHSKCAGHPEYGLAPGVEATTGPLGQGVANSVGMAIAERWLENYFNRSGHEIINYNIFAIASDGCMMEGISGEAASLAGHLGLGNLVWIYDNNHITIEGNTTLAFSEDVAARFKAYNWNVQHVDDANDLEMLERMLQAVIKETERPSLVIVDSHIAYGSPNKQDTADAHGAPLGEDEVKATKENYGWDPDKTFYIPDEVMELKEPSNAKGAKLEEEWNEKLKAYTAVYPDLAKQFNMMQNRELPENWDDCLPDFPSDVKGIASRAANNKILNLIASKVPWFMGGSADLGPSTKTYIKETASFSRENYSGRNFHFGIREHAMGGIINGMSLSKIRPYGATFLVFSDYARPAIRLSSLMKQPVIYIFTHDSIGVGEDGPTHQPVEHLASLRAIPGLDVIRPSDANELSVMWKYIMELKDRPVALILTRQSIPTVDRSIYASADGALKGAYILADSNGTPDVILIGTGSEVQICLNAYEQLTNEGIKARVVSMPCCSLYQCQDKAYQEKVLPSSVPARIIIEAGSTYGWHGYTGRHDNCGILGIKSFGASAPAKDLFKEYGFTMERVVQVAKNVIKKSKG
ncbi:MAG: transketolase 1 thiamin-binding isozyme [Candidatus Scalindua rubra]|uniref:Transketolase n=1 Tax=Candidatus Scalindua rubra TaxID=1872076 RepID=A0A1E3X6D2_9BACT|nr:MAG: transketolase 1 thiamin-binding isozyme [Candidatus Scalindua rubra]